MKGRLNLNRMWQLRSSASRWRIAGAGTVALLALALFASTPSTAAADGPTTLGRSDWQAARPYSPVVTPNYGQHGAIGYYDHIPGPVPGASDSGWTDCGAGNSLCPNAQTIGFSQLSRLAGFSCLAAADFIFYQSFVSPRGNGYHAVQCEHERCG